MLSGTFVVDLSRHLPGPLAARLLADLGARVVKVEEPALGDPIRISPPVREGVGALGGILLAGVESIALDLKDPGGREVLERLLALADVLERQRTGEGRWIDASLYDAGLHANLIGWSMEVGGAKGVGEPLPLTGGLPCYDIYETADGRLLAVGALEPHFWQRLCNAV